MEEKITVEKLAGMIDQTLLSPGATSEQVESFCKKSLDYGFASVCINPTFVSLAASILEGSKTKVCTVIDFPLGAGGIESKILQAGSAILDGASELDFVISLSLVKAKKWDELENELREIRDFVNSESEKAKRKVFTKLILETCFLDDDEIEKSSLCAKKAGFDFVKTSTGFAIVKSADGKLMPNGATTHAVSLMRKCVGDEMGVKASGGIRTLKDALSMIESGASRLGTSAGFEIILEAKKTGLC